MIKIDVISGFLGSGKTTFIKKAFESGVFDEDRILIIENEFGDIPIDNILLENDDYTLIEISKGCICCSLKGELIETLADVALNYQIDRVIIEPSGIFVLEDLFGILNHPKLISKFVINGIYTLVDIKFYQLTQFRYARFFDSQVKHASHLILSKIDLYEDESIDEAVSLLRKSNDSAFIHALPRDEYDKTYMKEIFQYPDLVSSPDLLVHGHSEMAIESLSLKLKESISKATWLNYLERIQSDQYGRIIRMKGFINIDGNESLLNYYMGECSLTPTTYEEANQMVIIGENLAMPELRELMA